MPQLRCPACLGTVFMGCEYPIGAPEHYDGISEWHCTGCHRRFGRWTKRELLDKEVEKKYGQ